MIVLDLDPEDRRHLQRALGVYVAFLRIHGESWPGVTALAAAVKAGQPCGHNRPDQADRGDDRHDAVGSQHERLLAPDAAAEILGVSARTLRRRVAEGEIPAIRLGPRTVRFDPHDLARYIERTRR